MFDKSTIEKLQELTMQAADTETIDGREYSRAKLYPVSEPSLTTIQTSTLESVVQYIADNIDGLTDKLFLHVIDPTRVAVYTSARKQWRDRETPILAIAPEQKHFFQNELSIEQFIVWLQAGFVQDEMTAQILKLVGNITSTAVQNWDDDGITQAVSAKVGLTLKQTEPVPNPVILRPFRTFTEVEQPASRFVLRLKTNGEKPPTVLLTEGDGGAWKKAAMDNIAAYFKKHDCMEPSIDNRNVIILQ
ncbi:hypothetical protein [Chrysiogenes arsenatis]|uniref:hypothetical protein n=1 Tax=Chrysiogenes arsenatis TaxID=309797 RepID=UPI0003FCA453|nr:hypothetical protein [Chrysiogenes arsenatis]